MVAEKIEKNKIEEKEEELPPGELVKRLQELLGQEGINRIAKYRGRGLAGLYFFDLKDLDSGYDDITFASQSLKWSDVLKEAKKVLENWGIILR